MQQVIECMLTSVKDWILSPPHTNQEGKEEYTYISWLTKHTKIMYNSAPKYSLRLFLNGELENI